MCLSEILSSLQTVRIVGRVKEYQEKNVNEVRRVVTIRCIKTAPEG